jgi:hypothetical protein
MDMCPLLCTGAFKELLNFPRFLILTEFSNASLGEVCLF